MVDSWERAPGISRLQCTLGWDLGEQETNGDISAALSRKLCLDGVEVLKEFVGFTGKLGDDIG
jgi:hypothetical protein